MEQYRKLANGALAGLVGSIAMNAVSGLQAPGAQVNQQGTRPDVAAAQEEPARTEEMATVQLASQVANFESPINRRRAGALIHYGSSTAVGAFYALLDEKARKPGLGIGYGLLLWAGGVLVALPALHLTQKPHKYPVRHHMFGLFGHLAYGITLETVYRTLQRKNL
jgi:uncharacterized membrane protein YagU involved in acid resistance